MSSFTDAQDTSNIGVNDVIDPSISNTTSSFSTITTSMSLSGSIEQTLSSSTTLAPEPTATGTESTATATASSSDFATFTVSASARITRTTSTSRAVLPTVIDGGVPSSCPNGVDFSSPCGYNAATSVVLVMMIIASTVLLVGGFGMVRSRRRRAAAAKREARAFSEHQRPPPFGTFAAGGGDFESVVVQPHPATGTARAVSPYATAFPSSYTTTSHSGYGTSGISGHAGALGLSNDSAMLAGATAGTVAVAAAAMPLGVAILSTDDTLSDSTPKTGMSPDASSQDSGSPLNLKRQRLQGSLPSEPSLEDVVDDDVDEQDTVEPASPSKRQRVDGSQLEGDDQTFVAEQRTADDGDEETVDAASVHSISIDESAFIESTLYAAPVTAETIEGEESGSILSDIDTYDGTELPSPSALPIIQTAMRTPTLHRSTDAPQSARATIVKGDDLVLPVAGAVAVVGAALAIADDMDVADEEVPEDMPIVPIVVVDVADKEMPVDEPISPVIVVDIADEELPMDAPTVPIIVVDNADEEATEDAPLSPSIEEQATTDESTVDMESRFEKYVPTLVNPHHAAQQQRSPHSEASSIKSNFLDDFYFQEEEENVKPADMTAASENDVDRRASVELSDVDVSGDFYDDGIVTVYDEGEELANTLEDDDVVPEATMRTTGSSRRSIKSIAVHSVASSLEDTFVGHTEDVIEEEEEEDETATN